ncbi:MAG: class I SAM-dependent rRNA methyltransferase [Vicinamibacterales bacterium]
MSTPELDVHISPRGETRLRHGHPWIYRSDVAAEGAAGGTVVRVLGARDRVLGHAFFSDQSQIALRMLTRDDRPIDEAFWRGRIDAAVRFRDTLHIEGSAFRLIHGEADLLPSIVVDRYGDVLVVQTLSQGSDALLPLLTRLLVERTGATGVVERNDPRVRQLEGLESRVGVIHGEVPEYVPVHVGAIEYEVDVREGQKTGLFLDQRENHAAAAGYARGRLLDAFSYHGGFALAMAAACSSVEALDVSADAVGYIDANARRNRLPHVQAREANAFDELRRLEKTGARYETIVLDPPAFAKHKGAVPKALAGYKDINLRALRLLEPGGVLVTCTCSHHVDEATFAEVVHDAALDAGATVSIVERRTQGRDHPVLLGVPETQYLKCLILRKLA